MESIINVEDWNISFPPPPVPTSSQDRPNKNTQNHAQNKEVGTLGRKNAKSGENGECIDEKKVLKHISEREDSVFTYQSLQMLPA
jgi:hypothetical protein